MALPYYMHQDNRKNGTSLWYARATHFGIVTLDDLAEEVQQNCSLKKSDCLAVNSELVSVILNELRNSNKVKLDGFGIFTPAITSKGSVNEEDFNASEFIKGARVNFLAKYTIENGKGKRAWTQGLELLKVGGPLHSSKEE